MTTRPERNGELSEAEQWSLLLWMEAHPAALAHEVHSGGRTRPNAKRRTPNAYRVGVAVGTLWLVLRRWW